jgi:hypothetical protein
MGGLLAPGLDEELISALKTFKLIKLVENDNLSNLSGFVYHDNTLVTTFNRRERNSTVEHKAKFNMQLSKSLSVTGSGAEHYS